MSIKKYPSYNTLGMSPFNSFFKIYDLFTYSRENKEKRQKLLKQKECDM